MTLYVAVHKSGARMLPKASMTEAILSSRRYDSDEQAWHTEAIESDDTGAQPASPRPERGQTYILGSTKGNPWHEFRVRIEDVVGNWLKYSYQNSQDEQYMIEFQKSMRITDFLASYEKE